MNRSPTKALLLAVLIVIAFTSCRKDDLNTGGLPDPIDNELKRQLESVSPTGSISYFQFPDERNLNAIPQDPANPLNPSKVELGKMLFHETGMGTDGKMPQFGVQEWSCSSCHNSKAGFQANIPQGIGEGGQGFGIAGEARHPKPGFPVDSLDTQNIRPPSIMNVAYQEAVLWNGQFGGVGINEGTESSWTEGTGLENNHLGYHGVETQGIAGMTTHRMSIDQEFCEQYSQYDQMFAEAFPLLPPEDRISKLTAGLAMAAYERTILATRASFQRWLSGDYRSMTTTEKKGALVFFGKGECVNCHSGPALNSMEFHALGMDDLSGPNTYNIPENPPERLGRGSFTQNPEDMYKFKVPQLYNLKDSPFYGHGSSFNSIEEVIRYKNQAQKENEEVPDGQLAEEFKQLYLTDDEVESLTRFIREALHDPDLERYDPVELPTGFCFPNGDPQSMQDLGCQ